MYCVMYVHTIFLLNRISKENKITKVIPKHTTKIVHFNAKDDIFKKNSHFILLLLYYPLLEMFVQSNWVFLDHCYYFVRPTLDYK